MDESLLPSMQQISVWREYSHRSKSVSLLPELQLNEHFCGESYYLKTPEEWKSFVEEREGCLLKAPLSERVKLVQRYIYSFYLRLVHACGCFTGRGYCGTHI